MNKEISMLSGVDKQESFEEPVLEAVIFTGAPIMADSARCCGPNAGFVSYSD